MYYIQQQANAGHEKIYKYFKFSATDNCGFNSATNMHDKNFHKYLISIICHYFSHDESVLNI